MISPIKTRLRQKANKKARCDRKKEEKTRIEEKRKKKRKRKRKFAFPIVFLAVLVLSPAVEMKKCVQMVQISSLDTHREKFPPQTISLDGPVVR